MTHYDLCICIHGWLFILIYVVFFLIIVLLLSFWSRRIKLNIYFTSVFQISSRSDDRRRSYDVISIFQDGGHKVSTSGFRFSDGICFKNVEIYFDVISQSTAEIKLLPVSKNGTATILQFYFWFRFWRMYSHQHIIIHLPAEFCSNRPIGGGDMTSYRFFNMAAIESDMYFSVQV